MFIKERRAIIRILCMVMIVLSFSFPSMAAEIRGSITAEIRHPDTGESVAEQAKMELYKIAVLKEENGREWFEPVRDYESLKLDFQVTTADQKKKLTEKIVSHIDRGKLPADSTLNGNTGTFLFDNLEPGIFLLRYSSDAKKLTIDPFLVVLPTKDEKNDAWVYNLTVYPKYAETRPTPSPSPETPSPAPQTPKPSSPKPQNPTPVPGPGKLPQTGMLRWPVFLMIISGTLLFAAGWIASFILKVSAGKRKKLLQRFTMLAGVLLILGGTFLTLENQYHEVQAAEAAARLLPKVQAAIDTNLSESQNGEDLQDSPSDTENPPAALSGQQTQSIENEDYIGLLSIPTLDLELPIMAELNDTNLRQTPCLYTGNHLDGSMILAGHNYTDHFGGLQYLTAGDRVSFTDMNGTKYDYAVISLETLEGTDVEQMQQGDWDLTLFTCTYDGTQRTTVRCERV